MITHREDLEQLDETALRTEVLIPLLRKMGYQDVHHWHWGVNELGKDIVAWRQDPDGVGREYLAVVAKAGRVSGGAGDSGVIGSQVNQCFTLPYKDPQTQEEAYITKVWVASNSPITKDVKPAILGNVQQPYHRHIRWVGGDELWDLVQKHLFDLHDLITVVERRLEDLDPEYGARVQLGGEGAPFAAVEVEGRWYELFEKYPGALKVAPLVLRGFIAVAPDTPEGEAIQRALSADFPSGTGVRIPAENLQDFELPERLVQVVERLAGVRAEGLGALEILPLMDARPLLVAIEIYNDDNRTYELPYVELMVASRSDGEIVLTNDRQALPIRVTLRLNTADGSAAMDWQAKEGVPLSASWLLRLLRLMECISTPGRTLLRVLETDGVLSEAHREGGTGAPQGWMRAVADLVEVQKKIQKPIYIPDEVAPEELETIKQLRIILRRGELRGTWEEMSVPFRVDNLEAVQCEYGGGQSKALRLDLEETETLFGQTIPLGLVSYFMEHATLADEQSTRALIASGKEGEEVVEVRFRASDGNQLVKRYHVWGPTSTSDINGCV